MVWLARLAVCWRPAVAGGLGGRLQRAEWRDGNERERDAARLGGGVLEWMEMGWHYIPKVMIYGPWAFVIR